MERISAHVSAQSTLQSPYKTRSNLRDFADAAASDALSQLSYGPKRNIQMYVITYSKIQFGVFKSF
ncbi:hypothetical protein [Paenibacillus sp. FSL K6-2859]|uniref:hypothetical protein n=1 Tax=Paenibacillus sp. FSL K6-2859 TaxID=2921482 RepID=UPI0030FC551C